MAAVFTAFEWLLGSQAPSSGAIDVVAIKQENGSIQCSPFHVKLAKGKKDVRVVKLKVNGELTDLVMKVGRAGEAFFVEHSEQHEYIQRRLRCSPPLSPSDGIILYNNNSSTLQPQELDKDISIVEEQLRKHADSLSPSPRKLLQPIAEQLDGVKTAAEAWNKDSFEISTARGQDLMSSDAVSDSNTAMLSTEDKRKQTAWTWTWGDLPVKSKTDVHLDPAKSLNLEQTCADESGIVNSLAECSSSQYQVSSVSSNLLCHSHEQIATCRMFSLCGQLLTDMIENSGETAFSDPMAVFHIIKMHAISQHDFYTRPDEVLKDPNLVVLVDGTLLTWPVAKVMFEAVIAAHHDLLSDSLEDDEEILRIIGVEKRAISSNDKAPETEAFVEGSVHPQIYQQPIWAGRRIGRWSGNYSIREEGDEGLVTPAKNRNSDVSNRGEENLSDTALQDVSISASIFEGNKVHSGSKVCDVEVGMGVDIDFDSLDQSGDMMRLSAHDSAHSSDSLRGASRRAMEDNWESYLTHCNSSVTPSASTASLLQFFQDNHIQDVSLDFLSSYHSFLLTRNPSFTFNGILGSPSGKDALSHQYDISSAAAASYYRYDAEGIKWLQPSASMNQFWTWGEGEKFTDGAAAEANPKEAVSGSPHDNLGNMKESDGPHTNGPLNAVVMDIEVPASVDSNLNLQTLSLLEIALEDICPGPARGEMYGYQCNDNSDTDSYYSLSMDENDEGAATDAENTTEENTSVPRKLARKYLYRKSLVPTQAQLESMNLVDGENEIIFEIEGCPPVTAQLFLWPEDAKLVVADIEGVILQTSKSKGVSGPTAGGGGRGTAIVNAPAATSSWGSLFFSFGSSSSNAASNLGGVNTDVTELLHDIAKNGYHIVYIATKSMTQSSSTKIQMVKATEKSATRLPAGPVFLSPDNLVRTFDPQRPDLFKSAVLRGTRSLFPPSHNPFYSGFCTNASDVQAFYRCGFPEGRIFLSTGSSDEVQILHRTTKWTYKDMKNILNEMFPIYFDSQRRPKELLDSHKRGTSEDEYGDFNYWKIPVGIIS